MKYLLILICAIRGHKFIIERILNTHTRKIGCLRCEKHWAMHDPTKTVIEWDLELENMYRQGGPLESL